MTQIDPIFHWIEQELHRQRDHIELIASENIVSLDVLRAQGSVLTNKYAEGYAGRRYYKGCDAIDEVEKLAIERVTQLFGCRFANVQPHSGSQANQSVFLALLSPGDTFLGMSLAAGGHLTHGAAPNLSGKWFNAVSYGVDEAGFIDMAEVERLAHQHKPKLIIAGGSAYPRIIDFKEMRRIADEVGALLMVDMAHFAGLVAGKSYPSPFPHAHVVTSTTHKTLRGPRGGLVLTNDEGLAKKINSALFPGLQGGPLMHVIAAKAIAFQEALEPSFETYAKQVCVNARVLSDTLKSRGVEIVSGGTDSHIVLVNLMTAYQKNSEITGKWLADIMESVGLVCNKNSVPHDPTGPTITAGVRLGSPAMTTRGFKEAEFEKTGEWVADLIATASEDSEAQERTIKRIKEAVADICLSFPLYPTL